MNVATCPKRLQGHQTCGAVLEYRIDAIGRAFDYCAKCDRHARGLCRDCPTRVQGKAQWCQECRRRRANDSERRARHNDPEYRARRNAGKREYFRRPDVLARRAARKRERYHNDPAFRARKRAAARKYLLSEGPKRERYLEYHRRNNVKRLEQKRAYARMKYYEQHVVRPDPHCAACGVVIAWTPGHGRPRLTCDNCCSPAERRRREQGYNAIAYARRKGRAAQEQRSA